jgi:hypothetical protein
LPATLDAEVGYGDLCKFLSEWEQRISKSKNGARVLQGLSGDLKQQLAALLVDIADELEQYARGKAKFPKRRRIAKQAKSRCRMAERKLTRARATLEDLRQHVLGLDASYRLRYLSDVAADCLKRLPSRIEEPEPTIWLAGYLLEDGSVEPWNGVKQDPTTFAMVRLYWFFRYGCQLSGDEAEVRTAFVRNAFWQKYDVAPVPYRERYVDAESKGCDAVRIAVRRFRLDQGTSH